jgi:hypothetical protein
METSRPFKGDVGPYRAKSSSCNPDVGPPGAPATQTLAPLGLLQPAECAKQAQHATLCSRKRPANPGWRPKRPDEGVLLLLCARARHKLCHASAIPATT